MFGRFGSVWYLGEIEHSGKWPNAHEHQNSANIPQASPNQSMGHVFLIGTMEYAQLDLFTDLLF